MTDNTTENASSATTSISRGRTVTVWVAAVAAMIGSFAVVVAQYVLVLGSAACADGTCTGTGPSETVYGLIEYGTPAVGVAGVFVSAFTARRPRGYLVPVVAWAVVAAAAVVLLASF